MPTAPRTPPGVSASAASQHRRRCGGVERGGDATRRGSSHHFGEVVGRAERVGSAELPSQLESDRVPVYGDDRVAPLDDGGQDGSQADGAHAEHGDRAAVARLQHVQHRAGAGLDATAQRRQHLEWEGPVDRHDVVHPGDAMLGPRGLPEPSRRDRLAVAGRDRRGAVGPESQSR
jgi:hypothetical protein